MKFCLTDGFKNIFAIEHEPISRIKYPINPGMKIKLIPPLICRRGSILLTGKNVAIISDSGIEELKDEFDLKSMLSDKIGTEYVGPVRVNNQIPTRNANRQHTQPPQARIGEFVKLQVMY